VLASLAVDENGRLRGTPKVSAPGLFENEDPEAERAAMDLTSSINDLPASLRRDDAALSEAVRASLRRSLGRRLQKRPLVDVHLLRV
jgi:ribonuclease J